MDPMEKGAMEPMEPNLQDGGRLKDVSQGPYPNSSCSSEKTMNDIDQVITSDHGTDELNSNETKRHIEVQIHCHKCGDEFDNAKSLFHHMLIHDGESKHYLCDCCGGGFTTLKGLENHKKVHTYTYKDSVKCDECGELLANKTSLMQHKRAHYGTDHFRCEKCEKKFASKANLDGHMMSHFGKESYKCDTCQEEFAYKSLLKIHIRKHTGEKIFECDICDKKFTLKSSLIGHKRIHTGEKPFKCPHCPKKWRTKSSLNEHRKTHTGVKRFSCHLCSESFIERKCFKIHLLKHSCVKPYKCDLCDKRFYTNQSLKKHVKSHLRSNEKEKIAKKSEIKFNCDICEEAFPSNWKLVIHRKVHSTRPTHVYKCDVCERKFGYIYNLEMHMRKHSTNTLFECDQCEKIFYSSEGQSRHTTMMHHMQVKKPNLNLNPDDQQSKGKKEHKCDTCNAVFSRQITLINHRRTHRYECAICKSEFTTRQDLRSHMLKKNCEVPFMCNYCDKRFSHKNTLKKHVLRQNCTHSQSYLNSGVFDKKCLNETFDDKHSLKEHEEHKPRGTCRFECKICQSMFSKKYLLTHHLKTHDQVQKFSCKKCPSVFKTRLGLAAHMVLGGNRGKHKQIGSCRFKCKICHSMFPKKSWLTHHLKTHEQGVIFPCTKCPAVYKSKLKLAEHDRVHSGDQPYSCDLCDTSFESNFRLRLHMRSVHCYKPFSCGHCNITFMQKHKLLQHIAKHKQRKSITNTKEKTKLKKKTSPVKDTINELLENVCTANEREIVLSPETQNLDVETENKTDFDAEMLISIQKANKKDHTLIKIDNSCLDMEGNNHIKNRAKSSTKQYLKITLKSIETHEHYNTNNFVCIICNETLPNLFALLLHQRQHSGKNMFACHICNRMYKHLDSLINHQAIHGYAGNHYCMKCTVSFSNINYLIYHQNVSGCPNDPKKSTPIVEISIPKPCEESNGPNPNMLKCNVGRCQQSCKNIRAYLNHQRTHGYREDVSFVCKACNVRFDHMDELIEHQSSHSGFKPFHCGVCNSGFSEQIYLQYHLRIRHGRGQ